MKLLYYNTPDALSKEDIGCTTDLINKNIRFYNSAPADEETMTIVSIILNNFENDDSIYLRKNAITFNVLVHNDLWILEDGTFRVFKIMEELDTIFNKVHNKNSTDMISRMTFRNANHLWANYKYSGYTLNYGTGNRS